MRLSKILLALVFGLVFGLVFVIFAGLLTLPTIARSVIQDVFVEAGADQADVDGVAFNPFSGQLRVSGLSVRKDGAVLIRAQTALAHWDWSALFDRQIKSISLIGGYVALQKRGSTYQLKDLTFASSEADAEDRATPVFAIDRMQVSDLRLSLSLDAQTSHDIQVRRVDFGPLNSQTPNAASRLRADIAIAAGRLALQGEVVPLAETPGADLQFTSANLDLALMASLAPPMPVLIESAQLNQSLKIRRKPLRGSPWQIAGELDLRTLKALSFGNRVDLKRLHWQGDVIVPETGGKLLISGDLSVPGIKLSGIDAANLAVSDLTWNGVVERTGTGAETSLTVQGSARIGAWSAKPDSATALSGQALSWQGGVEQKTKPDSALLEISGQLGVAKAAVRQGELQLELEQAAWDGELNLLNAALRQRGSLTLGAIRVDDPARSVDLEQLKWVGELSLPNTAQPGSLSENSVITLGDWRYLDRLTGLLAEQKNLQWRGRVALAGNQPQAVHGSISTGPTQLSVPESLSAGRLRGPITLDSIVAQEIDLDANAQISVDSIRLQSLNVASSAIGLDSSTRRLEVGPLVFAPGRADQPARLDIESLSVDGQRLNLLFEKQTASAGPVAPTPRAVKQPPAPLRSEDGAKAGAPAVKPDPTLVWRLGGLSLSDAALMIEDRNVSPASSFNLARLALQLGALDSTAPEQATSLSFSAHWGEFGKISLDGQFSPLAEKLDLQLKGQAEGIGLVELGPYVRDALQREIQAGQLDAEIEIVIKAGAIDAKNALVLHKFQVGELKKAPTEDAGKDGKTEPGGGLPIELALSMLKDSEGNIRLSLPVSGDLDDPDFDVSDAVGQAVGSALPAAAALFLQPLGTVLLVGKLAVDAASAVRFNPVLFAATETELSRAQSDYLSELAEKIKSRPGLSIKVCGIASTNDIQALLPAPLTDQEKAALKAAGKPIPARAADPVKLTEIAKQRELVVKRYLVNDAGVAAKQLVACAPQTEQPAQAESVADGGKGRVELGF